MSAGETSSGAHTLRRAVTAGLAVLALLAVGGFALRTWRAGTPPSPPDVDLTDDDPAVAAAVEAARAGVRRAPRSADAWGRLGMVLAAHNYFPDAAVCLAEAERLDPVVIRWPYLRGVALTAGDPEAAVGPLRRAVALCDAGDDAPRLRLAEVLMGTGQTQEAEGLFAGVLAHDPDNPRARLGLGQLACGREDWPAAAAHLEHAAGSPLTRHRAHTLLAEVHWRRGDRPAAERERRLAEDSPDDPEPPDPYLEDLEALRVGLHARLLLAGQLVRQGRGAEAVAQLRQLVRDYPESASAWLGLGRALVQQEHYRAAEQALREAARLDPGRAEVPFYLGVALFQQGRSADAVPFFRRAIGLRPDHAVAQYNLGQCLKAQGDLQGAEDAFAAAVRGKPHYAQAHAALGALLAQAGRRDSALEHLRLAVELDSTDSRAKELLKQWQR